MTLRRHLQAARINLMEAAAGLVLLIRKKGLGTGSEGDTELYKPA
jgi:hypothetical protein